MEIEGTSTIPVHKGFTVKFQVFSAIMIWRFVKRCEEFINPTVKK